ncbi:MAG: NADH-quinone oxidoreductase subunit C [Propionivibrio sp.]|uniref:NADH-quinone oxidoreductase subunit C n=1 Tax=Propionivibrio sp. TaxID=2212460 RepID=UPI0025FA2930|nr:NADH-quinone oxidoreductase subunit C [Propionivibrio sp.]MBL0207975.1 NADH-quinone oxidoreductase subunit C [Propionivibrio sp.]
MSAKLEALSQNLQEHLGDRIGALEVAFGEITINVDVGNYFDVMMALRDEPELRFEELMDLCGVDYSTYRNGAWDGKRFAAVSHLISIAHNWRVRVRCFAPDDDFPSIPSITSIWNSVNWFEREAFDLFGIVFPGHNDLRRILTDYGFIGHPFRKDFPISGYVEMRYDPDQQRVIYQPVTIEPREITPRIVREEGYGDVENA